MASGIVKLSGGGALYGQLSWYSEPDTASNSSEVTVTLQYGKSNSYSGTTGTFTGWLSIDGDEASDSYYGTIESYWHDMFSHTVRVYHDDDGKGSVYIEGSVSGPGGTSLAGKTASGGETITLDLIPRQASLSGAESFTDEGNPAITYSNQAGYGASSLQACIASEDGNTIYVPYRDIPKTGSSYRFNLTTAERNALRNATPNSNTMSVRFYMKCTIGSETDYKSIVKTFSIVSGEPVFSPTITDDSATAALTGNAGKLVRYVSNVEVSSGAAAVKGAKLVSQEIKNGSKSITAESGSFLAVESGEFTFSAVDSRGNTASTVVKKDIVEYVKLTCNIGTNAPDTDGNFTFQLSGNYFNASFGAADNTLKVEYRYKVADGAYTGWIVMQPTIIGNTYKASAEFTGLDYQTIYTFQARATDRIGTITTLETPMQSTPVFDWGADDFKVNGYFRAKKDAQFDGDLNIGGDLSIKGKVFNPFDVGCLYISSKSTSPAEKYGGTWEKQENVFILAAGSLYPAGSTGGEAAHKLTVPELASHKHTAKVPSINDTVPVGWDEHGNGYVWPWVYDSNGGNSLINATGGDQPHNNMPPYKAYYMWERIE